MSGLHLRVVGCGLMLDGGKGEGREKGETGNECERRGFGALWMDGCVDMGLYILRTSFGMIHTVMMLCRGSILFGVELLTYGRWM